MATSSGLRGEDFTDLRQSLREDHLNAIGEFNRGHAHGQRAFSSENVGSQVDALQGFSENSHHPSYQRGWRMGFNGESHPGHGAA